MVAVKLFERVRWNKPLGPGSMSGRRAWRRATERPNARERPSPPSEWTAGPAVGVRKRMERIALASGVFAALIAALALLAWVGVGGRPRSGSWLAPMVPNAAIAVLMLGVALVLLVGRRGRLARWTARSLASVAAVLGLLCLLQYLFPVDFGIDLLLLPEATMGEARPYPGRIEPAAALAIVLLGSSLAVFDMRSLTVHHVAECMLIVLTVVALATLFQRAFGMNLRFGLGRFPAMPVDKALALLALTAGAILLRPHRGWFRILAAPGAAGVTLRRLIPVAVAGPFVIGWLAFLGVANERLSPSTGLTLVVSFMWFLLFLAVAWTTRELHRLDQERVSLLESECEARAEAEEASKTKSDFLGFLSHELRTPMNSMISYAELLETGLKGPLNEGQLRYVRRIRAGGSHLNSMVEELLQFTRARRGVIEIDVRCVDAVELAREALAMVQHQSGSSRVELCRQLPAGPMELRTDPDKVLHVLVNFLGNALKFTKEGRVGVRLLRDERGTVYEVWDTGPGIPREDRERIFQEFTQLGSSTIGPSGTGLGLAISARFAEMIGGRVELDSWVGRGSVFRLLLPSDGPPPHQSVGA